MIAIVDYGCGNLFSVSSSLKALGIESCITGNADIIAGADKVILPGVGAFEDAVKKLRKTGHYELLRSLAEDGKHILGICLGMQLLFDKSFEYGEHTGLGLISGSICPLEGQIDKSLKIPHMGWNRLDIQKDDGIFKHIDNGDYMYFVHSFFASAQGENVLASAEYGTPVAAVVRQNNVYGVQFHPEKSGAKGLALLRAFAEL